MASKSDVSKLEGPLKINDLSPRDLGDFGFERARNLAFDAVRRLWQRRRSEGMRQVDLARILERDPGWISKALCGPGNWTMRTFGELVAGMGGEIEITVHAQEDAPKERSNFDAYERYRDEPVTRRGRRETNNSTTSEKDAFIDAVKPPVHSVFSSQEMVA